MTRHPAPFACALAALLATSVHAQSGAQRCPDGEADEEGISVSLALDAHPARVARTVDSLLVAGGYVVHGSPPRTGRWSIAPRFTWPEEVRDEELARGPHPGVQVGVETEARGDSTHVQVGARALCRGAGESEMAVELLSAATLATGLTAALDSLRAAGVDVAAAVERPGFQISYPETVGDFRLARREDYEDPRLGSRLRYGRGDGTFIDVYVYPGVKADSTCPVACAEDRVAAEVNEFVGSFPELVRRGYYRRMDVTGDDAVAVPEGAPWRAGRELVMEVVPGEGPATPQESRFILYSFPGYMVKVRATHPPSATAAGTTRRFVADLLAQLARQ